jgi:hypothetical protein
MGFVGFSIDGGMTLTRKQQCQAVADAAAMAAACEIYKLYNTAGGWTSGERNAEDQAQAVAAANGYTGPMVINQASTTSTGGQIPAAAPNGSIIYVNWPGCFLNSSSIYNIGTDAPSPSYSMNISDGCVEVVVHYYQPTYFMTVWGISIIDVQARAVARGAWVSPRIGVLVLNYTAGASLTDRGGGNSGGITVTGGNVIVDSNASNAMFDTGGAVITAPEFDVTGGTVAPANGIVTMPNAGQVFSGLHPTPDPFAYLQSYVAAQYSALPSATAANVTGSGTPGNPYIFKTGYTYTSIPNFRGNNTFIQIRGTGMIGFDLGSSGALDLTGCTIAGQGVCIYMNSGSFGCQGTGCIMCGSYNTRTGTPSGSFSGLTSGPMSGFVYYQPPSNTNIVRLTGNGGFSAQGTFYAPNAAADIGGNAALGNFGSQWVSNMIFSHGNGNVTINYVGPATAKTRVLCLVE